MAVEKRERKSGTRYRAYWRNPYTQKIERGPWTTEQEATRESDHVKYRLKHEPESFLPDDHVTADDLTVADILYVYNAKAERTESTKKNDFYHMGAIASILGDILVKDLTRKDLIGFEESQRGKNIKQNTIHRRLTILKAAIRWGIEHELIENNPMDGYVLKYGQDKKFIPPSTDEINAIIKHAPHHIVRAVILGYNIARG